MGHRLPEPAKAAPVRGHVGQTQGWVKRSQTQGKDYYAIVDPLVVLAEMAAKNMFTSERKGAIDELLESLELGSLDALAAAQVAAATTAAA